MAASAVLQLLRQQNDRREAEAMRLREQQERDAERAGQQGIQLLQSGAKLKDVEAAVGGRASEQHRALWRIIDTTNKQREKAAQEAPAAEALRGAVPLLAGLVPGGNPNTAEYGQAVAALGQAGAGLSPETLTPLFEQLSAETQMSPLLQLIAQQKQAAEEDKFQRREVFKSDLRTRESLVADAVKRGRDQEDELRKRQVAHYSDLLADKMIAESGGGMDPAARDRALDAIAAAIPGNRDLNRALVELEADSTVRSAQDEQSVAMDIRQRTGLRVPRAIAKSVVDGNAVVDQFSGLPIRAKVAADRQKVASAGAAMDALARAKASAQRIAAAGKGGGMLGEIAVSPNARYFGVGSEDADLSEYSAARDQLGEMLTYALTGAQAAQQQIDRILGFMPKVTELEKDPKSGGLTKNAQKRIEAAYRLTAQLLAANSMAEPAATQAAILRAFDARVSQYGSSAEAVLGPPARDPRLPKINTGPR